MEQEHIPDRVITDFDPPPAAPLESDILYPSKSDSKAG